MCKQIPCYLCTVAEPGCIHQVIRMPSNHNSVFASKFSDDRLTNSLFHSSVTAAISINCLHISSSHNTIVGVLIWNNYDHHAA